MCSEIKIILLCVLGWIGGMPGLTPRPAAAAADTLSVEDLIAGVEARAARLAAASWKFSEQEGPIDPVGPVARTRDFQATYVSGDRWNVSYVQRSIDKAGDVQRTEVYTYAWDGTRFTSLVEDLSRPPDTRWRGLIAADRWRSGGTKLMWLTFTENATPCTDEPLAKLLREGTWTLLEPRMIGDLHAWGLRSKGPTDDLQNVTLEFWLVPDHDFVLVEYSASFDAEPGANQKLRDVEIVERDGIWVMKTARMTVVNPLVPPEYAKGNQYIFELKDFSTKLQPEKLRLLLTFPIGAGVWDDIGKTSFISGIAVEVSHPDGTSAYAPIDGFPQYKKMTDYSRGITAEEWKQTRRDGLDLGWYPTSRDSGSR